MSYSLEAIRNTLRYAISIKTQNQNFEESMINVVGNLLEHIEELEYKVKCLESNIKNK
jgi:hypothetical protein